MKIQFRYDLDDYHIVKDKEVQSNVSPEDIKAMYETVMRIPYSLYYSSYIVVKEGEDNGL